MLANEIALNLKYRIGLKHFFNINLGIGIIKNTTFLFVFLTYLPVFLVKFRSRELVGCGIKFHIQRDLPFKIIVKTQGDMLKI